MHKLIDQVYSAVLGRRNQVVGTLAPALGQFLSRLQELSWLLAISGTWFKTELTIQSPDTGECHVVLIFTQGLFS